MSSSLVAGLQALTVSRSSQYESTRTMTDRTLRRDTTEVLSYQPRHMTYIIWPDTLVAKKSKDLAKQDLVLLETYKSKLRNDPTVPIYNGYNRNMPGDSFDLGVFERAFSYTPASIEPVKLGKQKTTEGFEALKRDMFETEHLNGNSEVHLFTYRPKSRNDRNRESEIHVRVWRESEFRFDGRLVVKREAWYDFSLSALGGPQGRSTAREAMWLTNLKDLLWRRTDEAFLQVLELMKVMDIKEDQVEWLHSNRGQSGRTAVVNPRDDPFRSFEISCADLDQTAAFECREQVKVISRGLLMAIFDILVDGAKLESSSSTPVHHQLVRSSEIAFLRQAIDSAGKEMRSKTTKVRHVHNSILSHLRTHMMVAFKAGRMLPTLKRSEMEQLSKAPFIAETFIRPDFDRVSSRIASRLCHFLRARACKCSSGSGGFHSHDGRLYYNPDAGEWTAPRKLNE